jgi:hypothetical protein
LEEIAFFGFAPTPRIPDLEELRTGVDAFVRRLFLRDYDQLGLFPPHKPDPVGAVVNHLLQVPAGDQPAWSYAPKPDFHPLEDTERYVQNPRAAVLEIKHFEANLWEDISVRHRSLRRGAPNLSRAQTCQLSRLLSNRALCVVKSDKNCGPVLMNSADYTAACWSCMTDTHVRVTTDHETLIEQIRGLITETISPFLDENSDCFTPLPRPRAWPRPGSRTE